MKSIIIAAPHSGSGKTTITIGLMECLRRRGLTVAPFKVGPDFIDPGYHRTVCGRPSVNLDGWMCPSGFVLETFAHHSSGADIAVIEGVMGLFDGVSGASDQGSTAHVARITGAPVVLVVDAKSQARSAAALVKGFAEFDPRVHICGVIFNNVASENHARVLREAMETLDTDMPVLGCIFRDERLHIPSRHLGLLTAGENPLSEEFLDHLAVEIERQVDLGLLWALARVQPTEENPSLDGAQAVPSPDPVAVRLAVAKDAAFCFIYEDNLRLLQQSGAEIVPFSPLVDDSLPDDICGLYLPGGYPELFADALAANTLMRNTIRQAADEGLPIYAECGGFMYLTQGLQDPMATSGHEATSGNPVPFVGVFPMTTRMLPRRKALGYREVEATGDTMLGPKGTMARGHEFHYSEAGALPPEVERVYRVSKNGNEMGVEGYRYRNCVASYIHLHFGSCPQVARSFVATCRKFKDQKHKKVDS